MPESYFQLSAQDQADALNAAAAASGRPPHLLEKDIWVVWSLGALFQAEFGSHLVFKGGTALSKAYKVIRRFSWWASRRTESTPFRQAAAKKKWSDEIRRELLPAWLRDHAHPVVQAELAALGTGTSRVTEDCIFIDYTPVTPASSYSPPGIKLEFGARSSGEPSTIIPVRCDMEELIAGVEFPVAGPRVMNLTRIFWEKAAAAHVYCLQGEKGLSERLSRRFHDITRSQEAGHLAEALAAQEVAHAVAIHKSAFFAQKDTNGKPIDYMEAVRGGLTLLPSGADMKPFGATISA